MKKLITILLSLVMVLGLAACGNSASQTVQQTSTEENSLESTASIKESTENSSTDAAESQSEETNASESQSGETNAAESQSEQTNAPENQPEETNASESQSGETDAAESQLGETNAPESQSGETNAAGVQKNKVLVAYFSATNTTEGVAKHIANGLNADIYEIVPEKPYTTADLNYNNNNSRTTIEMKDPNARPDISGSVENMEQYTTIFIGYPIWWGEAPRIVSTFMESYDFSGKTIVPFCTSGSSGMGASATNLEQLTSGARWISGKRLNGSDSQDTVMEWVNSLGLNLKE